MKRTNDIRETVRQKYGEAAKTVLSGKGAACCSGSGEGPDPISEGLYDAAQSAEVPDEAMLASLGCGNPTALVSLAEGETVLDLGSGGGIDVLLSAKRVGPTGFAYGLDMTDEMLELAERNRLKAGVSNVRFLKGHIEEIPLPDGSVDVVISNCVINLSSDKGQVLREAYRVLRPGGRFAVSDIAVEGRLPEAIQKDMEAYIGCVAGALDVDEYRRLLESAGFVDISIEPTKRYRIDEMECGCGAKAIEKLSPAEREQWDGKVFSAFVRARKPGS
ncbi:MAG TPA: arsenite methyltransferase [Fimbriimonadaceae bacterium]|nr:arsenite methyltransferase [Fimbriimonadaceae bacterium]HRJ97784.1 arsenite methyltransferase [Fimbriimonadaceae bacterium]